MLRVIVTAVLAAALGMGLVLLAVKYGPKMQGFKQPSPIQTKDLEYGSAKSLSKLGDKPIWALKNNRVYILVPDKELRDDIKKHRILSIITMPFTDNPDAMPAARLYTASGLRGLRVIDIEKAAKMSMGKIRTNLCRGMPPENIRNICALADPQLRNQAINKTLTKTLDDVFFEKLKSGKAGAIWIGNGRASFYSDMTYSKIKHNDNIKETITIGNHKLHHTQCVRCFNNTMN